MGWKSGGFNTPTLRGVGVANQSEDPSAIDFGDRALWQFPPEIVDSCEVRFKSSQSD